MSTAQLHSYSSNELQKLLKAASQGDAITLSSLLRTNASNDAISAYDDDSNAYNSEGSRLWTMLTIACYHQKIWLIDMLHSHGASMDFHPYHGETALMTAAHEGHADVFVILYGCGADVHRTRLDGASILHEAVADVSPGNLNGKIEVVDFLLQNYFPIDKRDDEGNTALHLAAQIGSLSLVSHLLKRNAGTNVRNRFGDSPLDKAAKRGHFNVAEFLLSYGASINNHAGVCNGFGYAVDNGHGSVVTLLLNSGAQRMPNSSSRPELLRAARCRNEYIMRELADRGFEDQAKRALREAVSRDGVDVVRLLIDVLSQDVNMKDTEGQALLHIAVLSKGWEYHPRFDVVALLLRRGANVWAKNSEGQTASELAVATGFTEAVHLLQSYERRRDYGWV